MAKVLRKIVRSGWIGFDLDGTTAHYTKFLGPTHIGEPIWPIIDRIKAFIGEGYEVRIFTARAYAPPGDLRRQMEANAAVAAIQDWLEALGLPRLDVTCTKDYDCITIFDDRAVHVEPNKGICHGYDRASGFSSYEREAEVV